jgi:hypothetical protein
LFKASDRIIIDEKNPIMEPASLVGVVTKTNEFMYSYASCVCVCMYQYRISLPLLLCSVRFMPCCMQLVIRTMYLSLIKLPTNPSLSIWLRTEACTERFVAAALWKVPGPWDTDTQAMIVNGLNLLVIGSNVGFHLVAVTKVITLQKLLDRNGETCCLNLQGTLKFGDWRTVMCTQHSS